MELLSEEEGGIGVIRCGSACRRRVFRGVYSEEEGVGSDQSIKGDLSAEAVLREGGIARGGRGGNWCHVGMGWD